MSMAASTVLWVDDLENKKDDEHLLDDAGQADKAFYLLLRIM